MRISVVIPTFEDRRQVMLTLDSLAAQVDPDRDEVFVIHDGNGDDLAEVTEAFPWVRSGRVGTHRGIAFARNVGVCCATGDVVLCLDADSYCAPGLIEAHRTGHTSLKGPGVCIGPRIPLDWRDQISPEAIINLGAREDLRFPDGYQENIDGAKLRECPWIFCMTCNISVNRLLLKEAGNFSELMSGWGLTDVEAFFRVYETLKRNGSRFHYLPDYPVFHQPSFRFTSNRMNSYRRNYQGALRDLHCIDWEMGLDLPALRSVDRVTEYRQLARELGESMFGEPSFDPPWRSTEEGVAIIASQSAKADWGGAQVSNVALDANPEWTGTSVFGVHLPYGERSLDYVASLDVWRALVGQDLERFLAEGLRVARSVYLMASDVEARTIKMAAVDGYFRSHIQQSYSAEDVPLRGGTTIRIRKKEADVV